MVKEVDGILAVIKDNVRATQVGTATQAPTFTSLAPPPLLGRPAAAWLGTPCADPAPPCDGLLPLLQDILRNWERNLMFERKEGKVRTSRPPLRLWWPQPTPLARLHVSHVACGGTRAPAPPRYPPPPAAAAAAAVQVYAAEELAESAKALIQQRHSEMRDGGKEIAKLLSSSNRTLKVGAGGGCCQAMHVSTRHALAAPWRAHAAAAFAAPDPPIKLKNPCPPPPPPRPRRSARPPPAGRRTWTTSATLCWRASAPPSWHPHATCWRRWCGPGPPEEQQPQSPPACLPPRPPASNIDAQLLAGQPAPPPPFQPALPALSFVGP